jgi:hypothetical protein
MVDFAFALTRLRNKAKVKVGRLKPYKAYRRQAMYI